MFEVAEKILQKDTGLLAHGHHINEIASLAVPSDIAQSEHNFNGNVFLLLKSQ